jgi:hypothetical protein
VKSFIHKPKFKLKNLGFKKLKKTLKLFAHIGNYGVLWVPSMTNVLPLSSGNNQGGYGVVQMRIERFDHIPSTIKLAWKTLKTDDKQALQEIHGLIY